MEQEPKPFAGTYVGHEGGYRAFSDAPRPNADALEAKRMEYLVRDLTEFTRAYDQSVISQIAEAIDDPAALEAQGLIGRFVEAFRLSQLGKHGVDMGGLSPAGEPDAEDRRVTDAHDEVMATYSRDDVVGTLKAILDSGY